MLIHLQAPWIRPCGCHLDHWYRYIKNASGLREDVKMHKVTAGCSQNAAFNSYV